MVHIKTIPFQIAQLSKGDNNEAAFKDCWSGDCRLQPSWRQLPLHVSCLQFSVVSPSFCIKASWMKGIRRNSQHSTVGSLPPKLTSSSKIRGASYSSSRPHLDIHMKTQLSGVFSLLQMCPMFPRKCKLIRSSQRLWRPQERGKTKHRRQDQTIFFSYPCSPPPPPPVPPPLPLETTRHHVFTYERFEPPPLTL